MKYLAFDIEAANGYKLYSICSIGVVIADEQFNVLSRTNIWINPHTSYNLNGTRKNVGIDLHLDRNLLNSSPDFPHVYKKVKALLEDPQYLVVGHAVDSDVRMLNAACKHYGLPSLNFKFVCSQLLYRLYKGEKDVKALSKIAADLDVTYTEHNSEDDAWMSLMTLKYLVADSNMSISELMEKYHVRYGANNNFDLVRPATLEGQISKKHITQLAVQKIKACWQQVEPVSQKYQGKTFCLARSLELSNSDVLYQIVKEVAGSGGKYSSKLIKCNVYVKNAIATEQDQMREKRVAELAEQGLLEVKSILDVLCEVTMKDKVNLFLQAHRQSAEDVNVSEQLQNFTRDMELGLKHEKQAIPMIPTYLCNVSRDKINTGKRILIDAGGTNFRTAIGYFDKKGKVHLENLQKTAMPASNGQMLSKQQFYGQMAQNVAYLANQATDIGFCFSYPVDMHADMDGEVVNFSKEVKAPEVVGTCVGRETLAALKKYGDKPRKIVILNDTVATLLGGMAVSDRQYSAYIGYIYGTGTNVCCAVDTQKIKKVSGLPQGQMLINMECGGYRGFIQGTFDKAAIALTDNPDCQLFEKMTSGKYLSEIIHQALLAAESQGFLKNSHTQEFVLKDVSEFLNGQGKMMQMYKGDDILFAQEVCKQLIDRAAKMGAVANAATATFTCRDKSLPVAIVCEGTTFHRLVGYRECFEKYLTEILSQQGISFEIIQGEDLNLVGTLMATMAL